MKMTKWKNLMALGMVIAILATVLTGCGSSSVKSGSASGDDPITFKLALVDPEASNFGRGAKTIADEVEKATDGKIKIEVLAGGALGGERDTVELAMANNLDIATAANSVLTNFIPEMGIIDQAFLWTNVEQAHAAVDGRLGELIKEAAREKGLHVIGFMESGFRNTFSTKPIQSMDDFRGVTIRTMENQYHQAAFEAFGAMPIAMAYNDVFTALQQGTIDACENATANALATGFYEVTKHITDTQHAYTYIVLSMSEGAWNKIPEDLQQPFLDAVQRGVEAQRGYLVEANEEAKIELEKLGVEFHSIDVEELQKAYQEKAIEKGFSFDPEWQAAIDEAVESTK